MDMVKIVDTTLRDGEQMPGVAWSVSEKVRIAGEIDALGIAQIEAGVPAMGGDEEKSIRRILAMERSAMVSTWNRLRREDVMASIRLKPDMIHISAPVSDIQIQHKLGKPRSWVTEMVRSMTALVADKGIPVSIGLEDASRADVDFLEEVAAAAVSQGAVRIRYADTVGILSRGRALMELSRLVGAVACEWEFHGHDDLGMAVDNSLAAVRSGFGYVDCTLGGIGERAGNCDYHRFLTALAATASHA